VAIFFAVLGRSRDLVDKNPVLRDEIPVIFFPLGDLIYLPIVIVNLTLVLNSFQPIPPSDLPVTLWYFCADISAKYHHVAVDWRYKKNLIK